MEITKFYSPNFDKKKRLYKNITAIIIHYTGMQSERESIKRLTSSKSQVSCHYLINYSGEIINIVPDLYIAWHAGISSWKKDKSLNSNSIGIEITNPGHEHGYSDFSSGQIKSLIILSKKLKKKYKIKKENILGHSDIAPLRKKDPGEKFPWKLLNKKKICLWHNLSEKNCKKLRGIKLKNSDNFFKLLFKFGYKSTNDKNEKIKIYKNFQRRFRPQLISSIVDQETYIILKSLV